MVSLEWSDYEKAGDFVSTQTDYLQACELDRSCCEGKMQFAIDGEITSSNRAQDTATLTDILVIGSQSDTMNS